MSTIVPEVYFVVSIFISFISARKGITTEIFMNRKFVCQSMTKKVFSVRSEIQCHHRCLREEKCEALNFNTENEARENCEVFNDGKKCTSEITMDGWKAIEFQVTIQSAILNNLYFYLFEYSIHVCLLLMIPKESRKKR